MSLEEAIKIAVAGRLTEDDQVRIGKSEIEMMLDRDQEPNEVLVDPETAVEIFGAEFESAGLDELPVSLHGPMLQLMDIYGRVRAVILLQRAISGQVNLRSIDGVCGPQTIEAAELIEELPSALEGVSVSFESAIDD